VFTGTGLTRTFGGGTGAVTAVRDADCRIELGDRITVVGASGSGKSTLLHLIAGLDRPTAGRLSWPALGDQPRHPAGRIAMVFQAPSLLSPLTVAENVALPLLLAGRPAAEAADQANAALDSLDLAELADRLPEEISGGQSQRIAVARAVASRPLLIVADEPTGQLDTATAAGVIDVLLSAAARLGAALVVASHDPAVADRLNRRWTMNSGVLTTDDALVGPC
jgi:ABC-type lipoprotein export system ATPase subunit